MEAFDRGNSTEHIRACVKQWKCVNHWVLEEIRASWETRGAESVGDSANEQWGNCRAQTECPKIAWAMMGQAVHSIQSTSCPKLASTESSGLDQDLTVHHLVPKVHWRCLSFFSYVWVWIKMISPTMDGFILYDLYDLYWFVMICMYSIFKYI